MKFALSRIDVPFDVLHEVAHKMDIEIPVLCIPTGEYQVAMEAEGFSLDEARDQVIEVDAFMEDLTEEVEDVEVGYHKSYMGDVYNTVTFTLHGNIYRFVAPPTEYEEEQNNG